MRLMNATRSELFKQFSVAIWWILAIVLVVYVGSTAAGLAAAFSIGADGGLPAGDAAPGAAMSLELAPLVYSLATAVGYVFPLLLGALLVTGEFRHQTLTPTFLATPRRDIALAAKLVAGVVVAVLYAVIGVASTVIPGAAILAAFGEDAQLGSADTWAMLGRMVLAYILWLFVGIGVGALVRNQVAAVVGVLAFTQFVEPLLRLAGGFVSEVGDIGAYLPGAASDALVGASLYTTMAGTADGTLAWWGGGLILLGYAAVFVVLGYLVSWRRDVS